MPSPTRKNVRGDTTANGRTAESEASGSADNEGEESPGPKDVVQLFAFDAMQGDTNSRGGGRPKRKLKAVARFESMSFDSKANCKIGEGFSCPRCSAVCSYDSKECEECQLSCCYEAGIGVVVLKERRVSVGQDKNDIEQQPSAASPGTTPMQKVTMQRSKKRQSQKESHPTVPRNKKRQSNPQGVKTGHDHPTGDMDANIPSQPAEGMPDGWVTRRVPRSSGGSKGSDRYYYSPKENFKFRSKPDTLRFLESLGKTNGDESAAMLLFKKCFGRSRVSSSAASSHSKKGNSGNVENDGARILLQLKDFAAHETGEAKMPAVEKGGEAAASQSKTSSPSAEDSDTSPSPGKVSVRVQLYEDELQSDGSDQAKKTDHKERSQKGGENDIPEKSKAAATSKSSMTNQLSSLQDTNNEMANLLSEKEAALRKAESTIAALSQDASSATDNIQQLSNELADLQEADNDRVTSLESSLKTEQQKVQDLERQLGLNEKLQSDLTDARRQKEEQATELQGKIKSLQTAREEKNDLTKQLTELQLKHDSAVSESVITENELRETISNLQATIQKKVKQPTQELASNGSSSLVATMQSEKDELTMSLHRANAKLGTLQLENEVRMNRLETACAEKEKEIELLKQQASKRMSQVYELTDQLSTALTEKAKLVAKLEPTAPERERSDTQTNTLASLTAHTAITEASRLEITRIETEKAEAVAKSNRLENTVDELQAQVERLSAELNASKTASNELRSQVDATNARCDTLASRHKECLDELERVTNEKKKIQPAEEAKYKDTIHSLEESINQQNEEMQTLNEAVSASDAQTADLIAQVSTLTTTRDELKAKVDEATKEVSQLQSTLDTHEKAKAIAQGQPLDVAHSEEYLSAINSEEEALVAKVEECIARLDSKGEETQLNINDILAKVADIRGQENGSGDNGTKTILSQAEELERQLTEADSEVSKLISDAGKLETRVKKKLEKSKDKYFATTKGCKTKLKQRRKKIQVLKADIAKSKEDWSLSAEVKDPGSAVSKKNEERAMTNNDEEGNGNLAGDDDDDDESDDVQLFAFDLTQEQYNWGRPKRKLKAIARFESMTFDSKKAANCKIGEGFLCPRCSASCTYDSRECEECHLSCYYEAGIGVVVLKERNVDVKQKTQLYQPLVNDDQQNQELFKSVLCHCPDCERGDLTIQGLLSHYAKEHSGKPQWQKVMFSCPFCPATARNSQSLGDVEAHVNTSHPGRRMLKPSSSKKPLRRREVKDIESGTAAEKQGPPSWAWTKIEHVKLLPDGGQEYPRELPRVIDFIDAQCKKQEENVDNARGEWAKLCKNEAETEAKALDEERLLYKRGIRERSRLMDQERLEKLRYAEKADEIMLRYEHEGGNKRPSKEDVEATKLCSRPIIFSDEKETDLVENNEACMNEECQLCSEDSIYRKDVLLDCEIGEHTLGTPASESLLIQKSMNVLNPDARLLDGDYFSHIKNGVGGTGDDPPKDGASKRLKMEEDKREKLNNTKHSLEFIRKYNDGFVTNAWATRKEKRKSSTT